MTSSHIKSFGAVIEIQSNYTYRHKLQFLYHLDLKGYKRCRSHIYFDRYRQTDRCVCVVGVSWGGCGRLVPSAVMYTASLVLYINTHTHKVYSFTYIDEYYRYLILSRVDFSPFFGSASSSSFPRKKISPYDRKVSLSL
jgi:hypothetical protein